MEAALPRHRLLLQVLRLSRWRTVLRQSLAVLREARRAQPQVDEALAASLRRAEAEQWPAATHAVRCIQELRVLHAELCQSAASRLGRKAPAPLEALLDGLELEALTEPRHVPAGARWATAVEVLADSLPLVQEVATFGQWLEPLFSTPFDPRGRLPFAPAQVDWLCQRWPRGEAALAEAWRWLERVDPGGGLRQEVEHRALQPPPPLPRNGALSLLHSLYWRTQAWRQLQALACERLQPLTPLPAELWALAQWLLTCEGNPQASLPASAVVSPPRAALFSLAYELWQASQPLPPGVQRWTPSRWQRLLEGARRVDERGAAPEARLLSQALSALIQAQSLGSAAMRGWRQPDSLQGWILLARSLLS